MRSRRQHRRWQQLIRELGLPAPLDLATLCAFLGQRRGHAIRLVYAPLPLNAPCGMLISMATVDYIVVEQETSGPHRDHIALHEISHLLLDHTAPGILTAEAARQLMPHLDTAAIDRVLGRGLYEPREEQDAELLASLLHGLFTSSTTTEPPWEAPPEVAEVIHRVSRSLAPATTGQPQTPPCVSVSTDDRRLVPPRWQGR